MVFCFLEVLATFGQKPKRNIEKTKKHRQCGAKGYSHRATVSRALFFCFCHYWPKTSKIREKKQPPQKNSTDYVGPSDRAIASRIVFFKVFWRFLQLVVKNKKSTNPKTSTDYVGPMGSHRAIVSRVLSFLFFVFSMFFCAFLPVKCSQVCSIVLFARKCRPAELYIYIYIFQ